MFVLLFIALFVGVWLYSAKRSLQRIRRSGINDIDLMTGVEFERRLAVLFGDLGYRVQQTKATGDFGADLILHGPEGTTVVQAKRYGSSVGLKAVQEAVAARPVYRANHAMVVTNQGFTRGARTLATANSIELWDRQRLIRELSRVDKVKSPPPKAPLGPKSGARELTRPWYLDPME